MELQGFVDVSVMLTGGVYALVHRGNVVYVGKSKVMLGRVYSHRVAWGKCQPKIGLKPTKGILFDSVWVRSCPLSEIDELEYAMINLYKPKYNSTLRNALPVDISELIQSMLGTAVGPAPQPPKSESTFRRRI